MYVYRIIGCKNNKTPWILGAVPLKTSRIRVWEYSKFSVCKGKTGGSWENTKKRKCVWTKSLLRFNSNALAFRTRYS